MKLTKTRLKQIIREEIQKLDESKIDEDWKTSVPAYSSSEAKTVMDQSIKEYAKVLRKAQYNIIKDWMTKAKSGVLDYFDINRGITKGDLARAYPYELKFLHSTLNKEKIMNRFKKYYGGKRGKKR